MAYLSENEHMFATGKVNSIICTVSSDGTVKAWNVQEVRKRSIWSKSLQRLAEKSHKDLALYQALG